ncbi:MAG: hypothetical protein IJD93_02965 [Ruminococcus sp.]|nr:hypothetical protein [Ruminococcus sp.]
MEIKLPQLSWFHQIQDNRPVRNIFTGSLGTDPAHGSLHLKTFNYKVYATDEKREGEDEDTIILVAECFTQLPFSQKLARVDQRSQSFEYSQQGIAQIISWLEEQSSMVEGLFVAEE